ncbi:alpha,alpha-trehalose-phosphate synthase (UDP-forming) [Jannaschia sp. CCS1]|uniref:alpha,alpha-trehalose-phosphate synthase (UDP-forming) n=1 Tax=Jannaschia sp. (strain CCS1) TaxID=290400 RepID=UPI000053A6BB|nr:trehalose-6-phosphate synthase [Jannaschia sp. CCS1]ABD54980.1 trehalose 6-phosphate synthase [Jannaschia sp. CCS1]
MSRLVVVSNRLPKDQTPAGGLVFALHELLSRQGGIWIGADDPGETGDGPLKQIGSGVYDRFVFPLSQSENDKYYLGYANSALWPTFHSRRDLMRHRGEWFAAYYDVNQRLARLLAEMLQPDDLVWIHDYHFLPLASKLRELKVTNKIGFFLHIPFPSTTDITALPEHTMMPDWLSAYDLLGLQTQRDVSACREYLRQSGEVELLMSGGLLQRNHRTFTVNSFPIGVDAAAIAADAKAAHADVAARVKTAGPLILGVDRLDYSKGLIQRVEGFGRYLDLYNSGDLRPTYLQIAPVSRGDVTAYRTLRQQLDEIAGSVNGTHADLDWTPIRYVRRNVSRDVISALYRHADICLVTPLADGMNLVAKEFIAAQDPEDPGVLILSQFAGAAEQLQDALSINPFDTDSIAATISRAISMPLEERQARHATQADSVFSQDIAWWGRTYLDRLTNLATD